jgi:hypothetical protein
VNLWSFLSSFAITKNKNIFIQEPYVVSHQFKHILFKLENKFKFQIISTAVMVLLGTIGVWSVVARVRPVVARVWPWCGRPRPRCGRLGVAAVRSVGVRLRPVVANRVARLQPAGHSEGVVDYGQGMAGCDQGAARVRPTAAKVRPARHGRL